MPRKCLWLATLLICVVTEPLVADELRPALLEIRETTAETYQILWKSPAQDGIPLAIDPTLPSACATLDGNTLLGTDTEFTTRWTVYCSPGLAGLTVRFTGKAMLNADVLLRVERLDGSLQIERVSPLLPEVIIQSRPGFRSTAITYTSYGIEHILAGFDHLLFVLALILLIANGRQVLFAVTAFTVAHSLTLAVATLGIFRPAQQPIEAVIALSILFLAVELAHKARGHDSLTQRWPWIVAFGFGLLHGFGFASALLAAGLPQQDIPVALLFFNLGVELGQVAFIGVVLAAIYLLRRTLLFQQMWLQPVPVYAIGVVAAFWTTERVLGFWS